MFSSKGHPHTTHATPHNTHIRPFRKCAGISKRQSDNHCVSIIRTVSLIHHRYVLILSVSYFSIRLHQKIQCFWGTGSTTSPLTCSLTCSFRPTTLCADDLNSNLFHSENQSRDTTVFNQQIKTLQRNTLSYSNRSLNQQPNILQPALKMNSKLTKTCGFPAIQKTNH